MIRLRIAGASLLLGLHAWAADAPATTAPAAPVVPTTPAAPAAPTVPAETMVKIAESLPPAQTVVYVLANDNSVQSGRLVGLQEGYLVLQRPDMLLRFSPQDIRGVFRSEEAAREALRLLEAQAQAAKTPAKAAEGEAPATDAEFLEAMAMAREKNGALRGLPMNVESNTVLLEAQNYLLDPQALLKPKEVLPVLQGCLLAATPKQKERAEELLKRHMQQVGSSELSREQKELIRSRVQRLYRVIAAAGTGGTQPTRSGVPGL